LRDPSRPPVVPQTWGAAAVFGSPRRGDGPPSRGVEVLALSKDEQFDVILAGPQKLLDKEPVEEILDSLRVG
jgi:hypothetical protein